MRTERHAAIRVHPLIACLGPFDSKLSALEAGEAVGRGLRAAGGPDPDLLALDRVPVRGDAPGIQRLLADEHLDARMLGSRAVVLVLDRLGEEAPAGGLDAEIATRARQSGVPAYAVTRERGIDDFDARVLDLQVILEAADGRGLQRAGRKLAALL